MFDCPQHCSSELPPNPPLIRLKLSVAFCSEYSEKRDTSRARSLFSSGARRFLLCSERFVYFRRYRIRGAHSLLLYGLPHEPSFYSDMLNALEGADEGERRSFALYSRFDSLRLERVLGSQRAARLLASEKEQHLFV
jgi:U3 small nucleolar RNA-associated protein 25